MFSELELLVEEADGRVRLLAPTVGTWTCARRHGELLGPRAEAGILRKLGRDFCLRVPAGVQGRIATKRPERVHEPVGYGSVLYELEPLANEEGSLGTTTAQAERTGRAFRAPYSGRFWHRPSPDAEPFIEVGSTVSEGTTVGLIEVMKTFTHLFYAALDDLPAQGKIDQVLVGDGDEVEEGDALFTLAD